MTAEQRQIIEELKRIESETPGKTGVVAWRAAQEIRGLIEENLRLQSSQRAH